jgi:hypothetical protein
VKPVDETLERIFYHFILPIDLRFALIRPAKRKMGFFTIQVMK